jgi:tetratricopeptide (TPR) repeat protein
VAAGPLIQVLQAWQRYGAGDYDFARSGAEAIPADAPAATQNLAALIRADSLVALDQPQSALALYQALDGRGWHDPAILNNSGVALLEAGDPTGAYGLFQRASAAQPAPPPAQLALILTNGGLAAEARKDLPGALAAYDTALKADSNNGPANLQRGYMAYRMGDSANAALYTTRAAAAMPDSPQAQRQLGLISLMQRKADAAIPYFQKALDTYSKWTATLRQDEGAANSRNDSRTATRASALIRDINQEIGTTDYYVGLAYSDLARGKPRPGFLEQAWRNIRNDKTEADRAIAAFQEAIQLDRDRPDVRYNMGRLYQQQGEDAKAREQYAQAKKLQPASPGPYEALAEMDLADKKPNDALAEYQALLAANPGYMTALIKMGDIYQAQGDKDGIRRTYGLVAGLPANTPQEHLWRAQALAALGRQDEAVAEGRAAVAGDPTLADAHLLLATIYRDTKQDNAALTEYDAVLKLQPDNVIALYEAGKLEAAHGNTEAARTLWQKVEQVKPDHPDVHFALAGLYEQRAAQATQAGNKTQARQWLDQAITEYNTAIQQHAGSADALYHLGKLQEDKGDWRQAEARYAAAVKTDPNQVEARQGLVRVMLKQPGRDDDALKAAQDFRKYAPNDARALLLLGQVFLFRNDPNSALTQYDQALRLQPGSPEAYYGLGRAYQLRGDPTNAQRNYQAALAAQPGYPAALTGQGDLGVDGGQYGAAQEYYNQALQSDPNYAPAYVGLGRARDRLSVTDNKLAEEARKALLTAADLDPTAAEPHFYLGEFYAERALWGQAVTEYKRASSLRPSWAMPQFRLGQVYLSQKASAEALAAYQQATKLDPQMIEAWFGLGQAERDIPNRKEAINAYRQALKLKGDYAAAWLYLGYTLEEDGQRQEAIDAFRHAVETATDDAQIRAAAQQALSRYQ